MKAKIFSAEGAQALESEINKWLASNGAAKVVHSTMTVKDMKIPATSGIGSRFTIVVMATVFYE